MQLPDLREFAVRGRRAWRTRPRPSTDLALAVIVAVALILLGWLLARPQSTRVNITINTGKPPTSPTPASNATSCPAPRGTVTYASPGADLTALAARLTAGNTLVLNDGTYKPTKDFGYQAGWEITGINGTAANPIIIEAAHDGGAVIDGSNDGDNILLWVRNSTNVILCGFDVRNSENQLIRVGGDGSGPNFGDSVSNITLERMTGHAAGTAHQSDGTGNYHCFAAMYNNFSSDAHILFQDDAAWGQGCRYGFLAYETNGVTFRRDWGWDNWIPPAAYPNAPRAAFAVYNSTNATLENDIGTGEIPHRADNAWYGAVWMPNNDPSTYPSNDNSFYGDVFYNSCSGLTEDSNSGSGNTFKDVVFDTPSNSRCSTDLGSYYNPEDANVLGTAGPVAFSNAVFADATDTSEGVGLDQDGGATPRTIDSVFINDHAATSGTVMHAHDDFYTNGRSPRGSTGDVTTKPNYKTSTYGLGTYLTPAPNLTRQGQSGADIGAHITYEYVNGVLTSTPLWPWPMESRILADTGRSVTYASGGGIWKTLAGVYP